MIDDAAPAVPCTYYAALQREARHAGDTGQRFTAKAERCHLLDSGVGQFGGGMAFQRQRHVVCRHAAAIVHHVQAGQTAVDQFDRYAARAGIDGVFNQFFQRGRRTFDHLAGRDTVHQIIRQSSNLRHCNHSIATKCCKSEPIRVAIPRPA